MDVFTSAPLSAAGRPILLPEEVEIKIEDLVSVLKQQDGKVVADLYPEGLLMLTSLRLISTFRPTQNSKEIGRALYLRDIALIEDCRKPYSLTKSTRLRICFSTSELEIGLRFDRVASNSGAKDEFAEALRRTMAKKSWLQSAGSTKPEREQFSVTRAGVGGIIRRQEENLKSADAIANSALKDLDGLMEQAKECISIVQRYAAISASRGTDCGGDSDSETASQAATDVNDMEDIMLNIGMVSPVTKFSAGRAYHSQLAKQLADLLLRENRLDRLGGMMTLPDLYCLFNRARGTEIVSPGDLLSAAELLAPLQLGIALRVFSSGVKVVQLDSFSEAAVCGKILAMLPSADAERRALLDRHVEAADVSQRYSVSIVVAKEMLLLAESHALLCRDEAPSGLHFYWNAFAEAE